MSSRTHTKRYLLLAGTGVLILLAILMVYFVKVLFLQSKGQSVVSHRLQAAELTYCAQEQVEVCIVSFSREIDGPMVVNFQISAPGYPDFFLIIDRYGVKSRYECRRMGKTLNSVSCTGVAQAPGEDLEFILISEGMVLAAGNFSIIGLALVTPVNTPIVLPETLTPDTFPSPSYPNPSYP